jgi:hypothetical protein
MSSLSQRLKSLAKRVEQLEQPPSLAGAIALYQIGEYVSQIETIIPTPNRGGRPRIGEADLRGLERMVAACKQRLGHKTDKAALDYLAEYMFGLKGLKKKQWVKTHCNRLALARQPRKIVIPKT